MNDAVRLRDSHVPGCRFSGDLDAYKKAEFVGRIRAGVLLDVWRRDANVVPYFSDVALLHSEFFSQTHPVDFISGSDGRLTSVGFAGRLRQASLPGFIASGDIEDAFLKIVHETRSSLAFEGQCIAIAGYLHAVVLLAMFEDVGLSLEAQEEFWWKLFAGLLYVNGLLQSPTLVGQKAQRCRFRPALKALDPVPLSELAAAVIDS